MITSTEILSASECILLCKGPWHAYQKPPKTSTLKQNKMKFKNHKTTVLPVKGQEEKLKSYDII